MEQIQMSKEEFIEFTNKTPEEMVEYFKANETEVSLDQAKEIRGLFDRLDNGTITNDDVTLLNMMYKGANNIELSDDELEKVAGGWSIWSIFTAPLQLVKNTIFTVGTGIADIGNGVYSLATGKEYTSYTKKMWVDSWNLIKNL